MLIPLRAGGARLAAKAEAIGIEEVAIAMGWSVGGNIVDMCSSKFSSDATAAAPSVADWLLLIMSSEEAGKIIYRERGRKLCMKSVKRQKDP